MLPTALHAQIKEVYNRIFSRRLTELGVVDAKDIENIKIIYHLLKERGFTITGAKKKLKENKADTIENIKIVSHLKDIREFLVQLRKEL